MPQPGGQVHIVWPAMVSQPLQRRGRRAGTSPTPPQALGEPERVYGSPRPSIRTIFFVRKACLQRGLEPLGRVSLLDWDHGWVSLCLTHSHPWALSARAVGTQGDKRRIPPRMEPTAAAMPLGLGYRCWGHATPWSLAQKEPRRVLLSHAVPRGQEGAGFC